MTAAAAQFALIRQPSTPGGTLGEIFDPSGAHLCFTCELPWLNNMPDKSCVPTGTYSCLPHDSAAHPHTWELENVPGRSSILIHNGNTEKDSLGCIVVGAVIGTLNGLPAVLNSDDTLNMLRRTLPSAFVLAISFA